MRRTIIAAALVAAACTPGDVPGTGTYRLQVEGTHTVLSYEGDPGQSEDISLDNTVAVYVDEGPNGRDLNVTFSQVGYYPPRGRYFEMRLYPSTFEGDDGTTTLGGSFSKGEVDAGAYAIATGGNIYLDFDDLEDRVLCAAFERHRFNYIVGTYSDTSWDVEVDAAYENYCVLSDATAFRPGYPQEIYQLNGTLTPLYEPVPEDAAREAL